MEMDYIKKFRVIIVEDELPARNLLKDYFCDRNEFIIADEARNALEALSLLQQKMYDLMLLDLNIRGVSGFELLNKLEVRPEVIFITAYSLFEDFAFAMGAVDYILKPFSRERFNQAIERFLLRHHALPTNSSIS